MSQSQENNYQHYRRGFLGKFLQLVEDKPIEDVLFEQIMAAQFHHKQNVTNKPTHPYNADIENLYRQYITNANTCGTFDFHERILETALDAFGNKSFIAWLTLQEFDKQTSETQSSFLKDTIGFISGEKRTMSLEVWEQLLNNNSISGKYEDISKEINTFDNFIKIRENGYSDLKYTILVWCQKTNGIYDLLNTLHILFGK